MSYIAMGLVPELREEALAALEQGNLPTLTRITDAIEQRWAYAAAQGDQDRLEALTDFLMEVVDPARARLGRDVPPEVHKHLDFWDAMFQLGTVMLSMHPGREALAELRQRQFDKGIELIELLAERPLAKSGELARASNMSKPACSNALTRLKRAEFIAEIAHGWYQLTAKGKAAAEELSGVPWLDTISKMLEMIQNNSSAQDVQQLLRAEGLIPESASKTILERVIKPMVQLRGGIPAVVVVEEFLDGQASYEQVHRLGPGSARASKSLEMGAPN